MTEPTRFQLANAQLNLEYQAAQDRLHLSRFSTPVASWLHTSAASPLFRVHTADTVYDANNLAFRAFDFTDEGGIQHGIAHFHGAGLAVEHHTLLYGEASLTEHWQVIRAVGESPLHITRIDSLALALPAVPLDLLHFASDWGQEFQPVRAPLTADVTLETRFGRSSKGMHPYFALFGEHGVLSGSIAWSGNWAFRFEPLDTGGFLLSGGLHDWQFSKTLRSGESFESPRLILVAGNNLDDTAQQMAQVGRRWWLPRNPLSATPPVEWNHWWSYNDVNISESVFLANVATAAQLGIELITLDAGWFGPTDDLNDWHSYRGDWQLVNRDRFPGGIRAVADAVHTAGMKFGLWCEIEGLGKHAALNHQHPEFAALRDGEPLGYVCFGNPQAQEWAYNTLRRLILDYDCDWLKLDFNLEPYEGCNRTDHGHGAGDGLFEHYQGYYRVLDRIRAEFPHVVLENCASGGLRIDLGILRHTHLTFLSDLDYPVHNLQVFWGASLMLPAETCLHWSYSEWLGHDERQQFNPRDPNLQPHQFDYYTRTAMLGAFGVSQKLPELPPWVAARLATHVEIYKSHVRHFISTGRLYRLSEQPQRDGHDDRWCAFQVALPNDEHLLFVFRLPNAESEQHIRLCELEPDRIYQIEGFEGEIYPSMTGRELMRDGIPFANLREEESALLRLS